MINKKSLRRKSIRMRIRNRIKGTAERPRLSVFRSNKQIYAQLIDDITGVTICAASTQSEGLDTKVTKVEQAKIVGKTIGEKAAQAGVVDVIFDRGGYLYHGRVQALAEGAREAGLKF